jgi:hypothetical protein
MARLVIVEGAGKGGNLALERSAILGRQKGVSLVVDDIGASREHCKVFAQDGGWWVVDLSSRNGTLVNGGPIQRQRLYDGDTIRIGKTDIRLEAPDCPPPSAAPPARPAAAAAPAAAPAAAASGPRGPSPVERERERIRAEAAAKAAGSRAAAGGRADDGSGVVVKADTLQYGRVANKGGLLAEDVGQRGGLGKILVVLGALALVGGIAWGIATMMAKEPVEEGDPLPAETK